MDCYEGEIKGDEGWKKNLASKELKNLKPFLEGKPAPSRERPFKPSFQANPLKKRQGNLEWPSKSLEWNGQELFSKTGKMLSHGTLCMSVRQGQKEVEMGRIIGMGYLFVKPCLIVLFKVKEGIRQRGSGGQETRSLIQLPVFPFPEGQRRIARSYQFFYTNPSRPG